MTTSKAIQIAKDIEDARCKGNWKLMPELARRYRKHNPKGEVLAQTISAEASLAQLVVAKDTRSSPTLLSADQVQSIQHQLQSVIHMTDTATVTDREFAKVVLARSYYECGDFTKAVEIVSHLSFAKQDVSLGYNAVLFLQARVIKAIGIERTGNLSAAFDAYRNVMAVVRDALIGRERVLVEWAEEGLYRGALVAWKYSDDADVGSTLEILRAYQRVTATQPLAWRQTRRMQMAERSLRYLCDVYRQGAYCPPERSASKPTMFVIEVTQLHALYEKMVLSTAKFPRANQVNQRILDYADLVREIVDTPGAMWSVSDLRGFTESLNRAMQKVFNSPRITRHLMAVHYKTGDYKQAQHALKAYLYMVGLVSHARDAACDHGEALTTDSRGVNRPIPAIKKEDIRQLVQESAGGELADMHDAAKPTKSIASRRTVEKESTQDTLNVLLTGIKMLCEELEHGPEAVELGEIACTVFSLQSEGFQQEYRLLGASVHRAAGAAYGLLANQTTDPSTRSHYHAQAIKSLEASAQMDPDAWQTYYQLALEQCTMRDVHLAVQTVTKALQINPDYIPSWHLLVLACSCPSQGGMEQALKTCRMSLDRIRQVDDISGDAASSSDDSHQEDLGSRLGFEHLEQQILLQVTRSMILSMTRGPEDALESQKELFSVYGQIAIPDETEELATGELYQPNGGVGTGSRNPMVVSGSLGNLSEPTGPIVPSESSAPPATMVANGKAAAATSATGEQPNGGVAARSWHGANGSTSSNTSNDTIRTAPTTSSSTHRRRLHPSLHIFRSKSHRKQDSNLMNGTTTATASEDSIGARGSYPMQASVSSLHSAVPSLSSTRSIIPQQQHAYVRSAATAAAQPTARCRLRQKRSTRILCNLWLLSASCFLELGLVDETLKAIEEAENVDWTSNAGVWCMLGRLRLAENKIDSAIAAFQKGLVCDGNDVECRVWLARAFIMHGDLEVAEGLLELVTRSNGWDCTEAWLYLGQVYRKTDRLERAKDCFVYALELERTQPIQSFSILPRCI